MNNNLEGIYSGRPSISFSFTYMWIISMCRRKYNLIIQLGWVLNLDQSTHNIDNQTIHCLLGMNYSYGILTIRKLHPKGANKVHH